MGRNRVNRTPEEQLAFTQQQRQRAVERQRQRRAEARQNNMQEVRNRRINTNTPIINRHYIGKMDVKCMHCNAKHFAAERVCNRGNSFSDCCSHGSVKLERHPEFPTELKSLFQNTHSNSSNFFAHIRNYNSLMSFASFNANLFNFPSNRPAPYCFKIQGQIYYQMNTALYHNDNEKPSFGQLYIIDPEESVDVRFSENRHLDYTIINSLEKTIRENNVFAKSYEMMKQEIQLQKEYASSNNENEPEMRLLFTLKPGMDQRRYNFQRTNEVAAVFTMTADGDIPASYVTIRNTNTKKLQTISCMDPCVEPWIYPLLYPYGNKGWHQNILRTDNNNRRVTRNGYAKYLIAIRDDIFNPFILARRLFQQWLVDTYVKIERDRITYLRNNQKQLRVDSYQGLIDHMQNRAENLNCRVGKMIILPSTFIGSPRHMMQSYQDAMAIVRKYGKPDLFITMTTNTNWPEIQENLLPGQTAADRPDLCARVFDIKKNHLIDLVTKGKLFGETAAHVHVIEFQKRGLSHLHLLLSLKQNCKLKTPENIDKFISAEIPDPSLDPELHEIVTKNMIHACGDWCQVDGMCSKHFPAAFQKNDYN